MVSASIYRRSTLVPAAPSPVKKSGQSWVLEPKSDTMLAIIVYVVGYTNPNPVPNIL